MLHFCCSCYSYQRTEAERHLHTVDHAVLIGEPLPEQDLKFLGLHLLGDLPHPAMQLSITNNDFYSRMYYLEILAEGHADGEVLATDILASASHLATPLALGLPALARLACLLSTPMKPLKWSLTLPSVVAINILSNLWK